MIELSQAAFWWWALFTGLGYGTLICILVYWVYKADLNG